MSEAMIIIGAGHAAVRAALGIREAGYAGQIVMIAEEGSDLPYERPPLSKWSGDGEFLAKPIVSASQLEDARVERVERVAETVTGIDTSHKVVTLGSGATLAYSKLLLAAGASARRLPEALTGQSPVYYLRDAADAVQDMRFVQRSYDDTHHITFGVSNDGLLGYACGIAPGLKVAKDIRFAMKLIENATPVDKHALADPTTSLKSLR